MTARIVGAACLAVMLLTSGCQSMRADGVYARDLNDRTRSVVMNYLFARGMAESYLSSERATPAGLTKLVRSNHAALVALRAQTKSPTWSDLAQADKAVRALIAATTALDGAAAPKRKHTAAFR